MPTTILNFAAVQGIDNWATLLEFLANELDWPMDVEAEIEEQSYPWTPDELPLTPETAERLKGGVVHQLTPFANDQPWGVFVVEFAQQRVSVKALRQVLRGLVESKRKDPALASWRQEDLLFICATQDYGQFVFAHFRRQGERDAVLATFSWEKGSAHLRTLSEFNLTKLIYPAAPSDAEAWRTQWRSAFDVRAVTKEFYRVYEDVFGRVRDAVTGFAVDQGSVEQHREARERRHLWTQKLFNRLLFVAFVQKKGWLRFPGAAPGESYLEVLWRDYGRHKEERGDTSFYRNRLLLLFASLNTPEVARSGLGGFTEGLIGQVKFLNGGLFAGDSSDPPAIDVPDAAIEAILHELFAPFNFTVEESTPLNVQVAVDPEMLGKVFEKLVITRSESGSYYTPKAVVTFMCREALKRYLGQRYAALIEQGDDSGIELSEARGLLARLGELRVIDPACGSGAYLLGMLHELHALHFHLDTRADRADARDDYRRKLDIITNNLYGVDLDPFAVNIARLRLWLSLAVEYDGDMPEPLPNLDFKIEDGDSLLTPDPSGGLQPDLFRQQQIEEYRQKKAEFTAFHGASNAREDLRRGIETLREQIAAWAHPRPNGTNGVQPVRGFDWVVDFCEVFAPRDVPVADEPQRTLDGRSAILDAASSQPALPERAVEKQPGGFDIVLANPPYGAKVGEGVRDLYFDRRRDGAQSNDTYGLFLARGLQLLRPGGALCYIVSNTWRTIKTHRPLRRKLLHESAIHHVLDLPRWIFDATVDTGILTLTREQPDSANTLIAADLAQLPPAAWDALEAELLAAAHHSPDVQTLDVARYTYRQSLIATCDNLSFFIGSPRLYSLMSDARFQKLGVVADVKVGLQTGDNDYYLRKRPDVRGSYELLDETKLLTPTQVAKLTAAEKRDGVDPKKYGGRHFVPCDKGGESDAEGGWLPNYHVPTGYFIDWSREAVQRLRTATIADVKRRQGREKDIRSSDESTHAAVIRNAQFYFREGITFSRTGIYAPTFRSGAACVFDMEGSSLFTDAYAPHVLLALLSSRLSRCLIKSNIDHTVHVQVDDLKELPLPALSDTQAAQLESLVARIIVKQQADLRYPYHLHEQREIDALIYKIYDLEEADIREVELWYCRRYAKLAKAQGVWAECEQKYARHLARCAQLRAKPPGYWAAHPLLTVIAGGENDRVEFKESLEADNRTGAKLPSLVEANLKEVAAFLNTNGGTLLIGVADDRSIKGLDKDIALTQKKNLDGFELKLQDLLSSHLTPQPLPGVRAESVPLKDGIICCIEVEPLSPDEVAHLDGKVYIRQGPRTVELKGQDLTHWQRARFRG